MKPIYYSQKEYFQEKLGGRYQKIPLTLASTCPNREGLRGMQTCVFCDEWGSSAYPEQRAQSVEEQIASKMEIIAKARSVNQFLAYFQTYTTTFMSVQKLRAGFDSALKQKQIKGIIVGTRPDCLSPAVFKLLGEYSGLTHVAIELGIQSFLDHHLAFLRRGHSASVAIEAIKKIKAAGPWDLGVHLIFGLPNETDEEIVYTAKLLSQLEVTSVKLHNLHVLRGTPLEQMHKEGLFIPISLEEYSRRVGLFLQHLNPNIYIERLAALSSRWNELVAPLWTRHKLKTHDFIVDSLAKAQIRQGEFAQAKVYLQAP